MKGSGLGVFVLVEFRYPIVPVGEDILCCVIAADVVVLDTGSELVCNCSAVAGAVVAVLLTVEVEGGPVTSVES